MRRDSRSERKIEQYLANWLELLFGLGLQLAFIYFLWILIDNWSQKTVAKEESKFDIKLAKDCKERLDHVKGIDEIREEIDNLIKMIKNPDEYTAKGAKLHKGVLLSGAPGVGKTLLSRAISGEA